MKNATTGMVLDWPIRATFVMNANGKITVERYLLEGFYVAEAPEFERWLEGERARLRARAARRA